MRRLLLATSFLFLGAAGLYSPAAAQVPEWNPGRLELTRTDLQSLLAQLEAVEQSSAYSGAIRDQARESIGRVEKRLREGDFAIGDAVILTVENETQLSGTFPVQPGPTIHLAEIGDIPLTGVLRSELPSFLTAEIGRFVRTPVVQARSMVRLSVQGNVGSPGYYLVPAEELLSQALMRAGGPGATADLNKMRVERAQRVVWGGAVLQDEIAAGRTLDQLGLLAGDQVIVPTLPPATGWFDRTGLILGLVGTVITSYALLR